MPPWSDRLSVVSVLLIAACGGSAYGPDVIRLVDEVGNATVTGTPEVTRSGPGSHEWVFAEQSEHSWTAGHGIDSLGVDNGRLQGISIDEIPILHVEREEGLDDADELHAVEIRMRISAGETLSLRFSNDEELDLRPARGNCRECQNRHVIAALSGHITIVA